MTSRTRRFASPESRAYRARLDRRRRANRALHHWQNRPMTAQEERILGDIKRWVDAGASLSLACMNAEVRESQFAGLVAQLEAGRNSEFAASLSELLRTPWHWEKDSKYIRDHSCSDREILYGLDD